VSREGDCLLAHSARLAVVGEPGIEPHQLAMVAVHAWDVRGAVRAGLVGGWASHNEGTYPPTFDPPDVSGIDLADVVDDLLALPDD
jgi:2-haloacid dehalogenase